MPDSYHLDYETASACPIGLGAYKYSEDPTTRILMFAVARNDEDPVVWSFDQPDSGESKKAKGLLRDAIVSGAEIWAFNVAFEIATTLNRLHIDVGITEKPAVEQWRCTQAIGRRLGCPPSLEKMAEFLEVGIDKDKRGAALIRIFSNLSVKTTIRRGGDKVSVQAPDLAEHADFEVTVGGASFTIEEAWKLFREYCRKDVLVEKAIHEKVREHELKGHQLEGFQFDLRLNLRGVPVDLPTLRRANRLIDEYREEVTAKFRKITGLNPTQNEKVGNWFRARGYPYASLAKDWREKAVLTDPKAAEAMGLYGLLGYAAVKKVPAMMDWVCKDGKIRGSFTLYGAQKTGRWTSGGPQFQNMKKPSKRLKEVIETAYQSLQHFDLKDIEFFYGNPYEVLASLARYFVREDEPIFDADFAQVEARILPALIECDRILDKFRRGEDPYQDVAKALNTDRQNGKIISLLCQFGGGWRAVKLPMGDSITESEARKAVKVYRKENPEVVSAWKAFQNAWVAAFQNPGKWVNASKHVRFGYTVKGVFPRMLMRLPSGRDIVYPHPDIEPITMQGIEKKTHKKLDDGTIREVSRMEWVRRKGHLDLGETVPHFHTHELWFYGHVKGKTYGRVKTYGGDLLQSATQGTGMDLLLHGCVEAEKRGYEPFFVVHDQALASGKGDIEGFIDALCTRPKWFPDFPLEADGTVAKSYSKD